MFNRIALCFALGFQSLITVTYASNDLKKWNSEQGQLVRQKAQQKLKTTTYREVDSFQVKDARVVSPQKINKQIGLNVENNGSKAGVTIDALKDKNVSTTAQKWGKELGKGAVRFTAGAFLVEAGVQAMLDSVDWLLDPANNGIQRKPNEQSLDSCGECSTLTNVWHAGLQDNKIYFGSPEAAARAYFKATSPNYTLRNIWISRQGESFVYYRYDFYDNGTLYQGNSSELYATRISNPNFGNPTTPDLVPESEIIDVLEDYLKDPETPQNIKDIFHSEAEKPSGKGKVMWSDDPESVRDIFSDDKEIVEDILKSDDPVGEGLTDKVPDITSGTETEGDTTPKENPESEFITDPVTGDKIPNPNYNPNYDAGSSFKFELPAFCDYASIVCDWIDWTKEKPDEEEKEEEEDIDDRGIFDREFDINFFIPSSCPPDYTFRIQAHKNLTGTFNVSFSWLCMFFGSISYALIFASHCLGAWIFYEIAIKRNNHSV